jgi:hypothetical protein
MDSPEVGGAANVWVGYQPHQVTITSGKPAVFSKTPGISRSFCSTCGTSIAYQDDGIKDELYLTLGFFDGPEGLPPSAHAYWRLRLPWVSFADTIPRTPSRASGPIAGLAIRPSARRLRERYRARRARPRNCAATGT